MVSLPFNFPFHFTYWTWIVLYSIWNLSNSIQGRREIINTNTTYISKLLIESILLLCLKLILSLLEREVEFVSSWNLSQNQRFFQITCSYIYMYYYLSTYILSIRTHIEAKIHFKEFLKASLLRCKYAPKVLYVYTLYIYWFIFFIRKILPFLGNILSIKWKNGSTRGD